MVHRKGIVNCSCTNAIYPAQAIQWDKCNFTRFSTYFRFEDFFLNFPRATDNAVVGHMRPVGL